MRIEKDGKGNIIMSEYTFETLLMLMTRIKVKEYLSSEYKRRNKK